MSYKFKDFEFCRKTTSTSSRQAKTYTELSERTFNNYNIGVFQGKKELVRFSHILSDERILTVDTFVEWAARFHCVCIKGGKMQLENHSHRDTELKARGVKKN